MTRPNLTTLLDGFLQFAGDRAVVETEGYRRRSATYRELRAAALFWSRTLRAHGIASGDRVLLWGRNSAAWVAAFWGVLLSGAVAVPVDSNALVEFVERTIGQSGAKLVLRDAERPELRTPSLVIDSRRRHSEAAPSTEDAAACAGCSSTRSSVAEILFTSGTTSEPRGVVLSHGNFLANLEPVEEGIKPYLKYERWLHPLRLVSLVPLSHVFGQFMALFVPPVLGATLVFENSANPNDILRTIRSERATALIGVPRMLDLVRRAIERRIAERGWQEWFDRSFLSASNQTFLERAWRFRRIHRLLGFRFWAFISGGAALGSDTELFFKRLGYAVVQGYGMTETASLVSLNHPFRAAEGSIGKILPGREFKLADDGEILVRGENVSAGYWEHGKVQPPAGEPDGWLSTGDLGELDAQGNLKFRGRKKNVIVTSAGLNIYPEDLEAQLRNEPAVRDAVVVPLDLNGNAEACAVLLPRPERDAGPTATESLAAAIRSANRMLAPYQQIRNWVLWPELDFPRTPTGKPRLGLIAARAGEILGRTSGPEPRASVPPDASRLDRLLGSAAFRAETSLDSLSSLDRVELVSALEQRYQVEISEAALSEARTAADLARLIGRPAAEGAGADAVPRLHYPRWAQRAPARWFRLFIYYSLVWPATKILAHPRFLGRQHLDGLDGPLLIVANHVTRRADIGLVLAALPARFRHRLLTAMGAATLERMRIPPREWFFARRWSYQAGYVLVMLLFNVFPLPQLSGVRESFRFAGESVERGYSLLIFPEGEVNNSADGRLTTFRPGIGLLALNLALPVVPMRIDGVWQMKRERRRLARKGEIVVRIGAPVRFPDGTLPAQIARHLESLVAAL
jgi:long-chain acyl-CoA synthetase